MTVLSRRNLMKGAVATTAAAMAPAMAEEAAKPAKCPIAEAYPASTKSAALYQEKMGYMSKLADTNTFLQADVTMDTDSSLINACRWGIYYPILAGGKVVGARPFGLDYAPSPNLQGIAEMPYSSARIRYPMVRESYLKQGPASRSKRGRDRWIRVSWDKALDLAAKEIQRMYDTYGPSGIYGSSYGWMSTGKVNAAINLQHRLLNLMGAMVKRRNSYSSGAVNTILPYVVGSGNPRCTSWDVVLKHSERVVFWGANPCVTNDIDWVTTIHNYAGYMRALKTKGTKTYSINPLITDTAQYMGSECIRPNPGTDTAMMAAMIYELEETGKCDHKFLEKYTYGWPEVRKYLFGQEDGVKKTPEWAAKISGVPADKIRALAHDLQEHRTMLMIGWGIQRIDFGEQFHWMLVTLAAALGQIGLPGGGFGTSYHYSSGGAPQSSGPFLAGVSANPKPVKTPKVPMKGTSPLPVAAINEALENPWKTVNYDGKKCQFPEFHMIMWAGGNPMAHHPDTNRLVRNFRKVDTVIVTDIVWTATARMADIVFPACTSLEHNDITNIGTYSNDGYVAMKQAIEPQYESRSDYWIFSHLAEKLGVGMQYTEGRTEMQWIEKLYNDARAMGAKTGIAMPDFKSFWDKGYLMFDVSDKNRNYVAFADFRADPEDANLPTESGKIQLYSPKIAGYKYDDCRGHACYFEPTEGVAKANKEFPLALMATKGRWRMHSQLDATNNRNRGTINDREPVWINPVDAKPRGIVNGDVCLVSSRRGQVLAGAIVTDRVMPGVIGIHHGGWYDPVEKNGKVLDIHGNSNTLTLDKPTSQLARSNVASSANVQIAKFKGELPMVKVFSQPRSVIG